MVADESIKEKGIDIGDTIIDPVSKKEFKIVGFTKDQMFSHTPVVYVNEDVWGSISQPNQKDYSAIALNTDKEIKNTHVIDKKEVLQSIPGFKRRARNVNDDHCILTCNRCVINRCILLRHYTAKNTAIRCIKRQLVRRTHI